MIIGFDPGRDKCGIAVRNEQGQFPYHQVVKSEEVIATLQFLCQQFPITLLVMGNQTTSKQWKKQLEGILSPSVSIEMVDENLRNTSTRLISFFMRFH